MIRCKLSALFAILFLTTSSFAQLTVPPDGGNKKASVSERIGITDVTIHYERPGEKGREGKTWSGMVHSGFKDLSFGSRQYLADGGQMKTHNHFYY